MSLAIRRLRIPVYTQPTVNHHVNHCSGIVFILTEPFDVWDWSDEVLAKLVTRRRIFLLDTNTDKGDDNEIDFAGEDDAEGKDAGGVTSSISISMSPSSASKISDYDRGK